MRRRYVLPVALAALAIVAAVALLFLVAGGASAGGTLASGRSVTVQSDSLYLACEFQRDTAVVRTVFDAVVVKPDRVQIGEQVVAQLDENAKNVELYLENGEVTVVADGRRVASRGSR